MYSEQHPADVTSLHVITSIERKSQADVSWVGYMLVMPLESRHSILSERYDYLGT